MKTTRKKKQGRKRIFKDEPLLVAHLLGGRYGMDTARPATSMEIEVERAIKVNKEILRQLGYDN